MAVTVGNGTVTPVVGTEQDVATIAPGISLDNLSVYVVGGTGGGGGPLEFALYATVGGFRTRVAQKKIMGDDTPSIIDWDSGLGPLAGGGNGAAQTELLDVGGTAYTVTVIDLSARTGSPRNPVSVTIAGVDTFDIAPGANFGQLFPLAPGATGTLPVFAGYSQRMDVAVDQTNLPPVTVAVTADCGPGSVLNTVVVSVNMTGRDNDIASVFAGIKLPVATRYFVSVTNNSNSGDNVILTGVTYSETVASGGVVILNGDVIGPSNANTVIKWDNVPLLLAGLGNFGAPVDAAVPIFDAGLGVWRNFALSGDATMTDAGVVTINPAFVNTLGGDVIGPSNNNIDIKWSQVPLLRGAAHGFEIGDLVDAEFPIFDAGLGLWRAFVMSGDATMTDSGVVTINPAFVNTLAGNVNGPSNANRWTSLVLANTVGTPVTTIPFVGTVPGDGWWYVAVTGVTVNRTVNLPAAPTAGEVVVITDEGTGPNAFLAPGNTITVNGNGPLVEDVASFVMTNAYPGTFGSICLQFDGTNWYIFADYAPNATGSGVVALTGNVNGPSNANRFTSLNLQGNDANVLIAADPNGGWQSVRMRGLTADRTVTLPNPPTDGQVVIVKDGDGSLGGPNPHNIIIDPGPFSIDEVAGLYTMTAVQNGVKGSVSLYFETAAPAGWYFF